MEKWRSQPCPRNKRIEVLLEPVHRVFKWGVFGGALLSSNKRKTREAVEGKHCLTF